MSLHSLRLHCSRLHCAFKGALLAPSGVTTSNHVPRLVARLECDAQLRLKRRAPILQQLAGVLGPLSPLPHAAKLGAALSQRLRLRLNARVRLQQLGNHLRRLCGRRRRMVQRGPAHWVGSLKTCPTPSIIYTWLTTVKFKFNPHYDPPDVTAGITAGPRFFRFVHASWSWRGR